MHTRKHPASFHISSSNVNYLGAVVFTLGCSVLVVNAVLSFLPFIGPNFKLPAEVIYVEGALSLMSNALFLAGSAFAFMQIVNAEREKRSASTEEAPRRNAVDCKRDEVKGNDDVKDNEDVKDTENATGSEDVKGIDEQGNEDEKCHDDAEHNENSISEADSKSDTYSNEAAEGPNDYHHFYTQTPASSSENLTANYHSEAVPSHSDDIPPPPYTRLPEEFFRLVPSTHEVWTRCIHEIGFLSTYIFFCSSLLYFSSSIASIVTIVYSGEISRWIRYPQLIAAVGFAVASVTLMIQTQRKWWQPAWHSLRWYVHVWNVVGSAGFIFCACFGLIDGNVYWAKYQFGMSYLWGSWAFLFGSLMQWYKSLGKHNTTKQSKDLA